ncbi:hypothetical protein [Phytohabitans rumicis]|uniref:Uncharacterized protein n=1 Tax=Phytohabitans rumicis TaxID=1076125 RepID=A0A6V8L2S0_9ACTN|nr:hypothetical protein [Phytohabitans rumicis]GFJ91583.1 hypothetical protein Prum_052250 [Phytohabitans rumicis]
MGALAATVPTRAGVATPGAAVAASDTIASTLLGSRGALLEILNGNAGTDNMTISDASVTPTSAAAAALAPALTTGTNRVFFIHPSQADPVTGLVTVTHSVVSTVTYKLYPLG